MDLLVALPYLTANAARVSHIEFRVKVEHYDYLWIPQAPPLVFRPRASPH